MANNRIYSKGRDTSGLVRGERVTDIGAIREGELLIEVNHNFRAENPLIVHRVNRDSIYAQYSVAPLAAGGFQIWAEHLNGCGSDFYKAVAE